MLPTVRTELRAWQRTAAAIPDPELRAQALATLHSERLSTAGAALFATTLRRHDPLLVRTLVAYQVICDYLDTLSEQPAADPVANGMLLHRALADAVAPQSAAQADWYRLHAVGDDGGYLATLVDTCRSGCAAFPAYPQVRDAALREARRNEVQGIKHGPAPQRKPQLRHWAEEQGGDTGDTSWFELAAAGSSPLAVLALLAAAADPATSPASVELTRACYFPWIEALSTLLDSLADREHDEAAGEMSFVSQYPSDAAMTSRLQELTVRALAGARGLPNAECHVVLVAGMIALHLSDRSAWLPASQPTTNAVLDSARTIVMPVLLAILSVWRLARRWASMRPCVVLAISRSRRAACARACDPSGGGPLPA